MVGRFTWAILICVLSNLEEIEVPLDDLPWPLPGNNGYVR